MMRDMQRRGQAGDPATARVWHLSFTLRKTFRSPVGRLDLATAPGFNRVSGASPSRRFELSVPWGSLMKKLLCVAAAFAFAMVLFGQGARAEEEFRFFRGDRKLIVPTVAVGAATTGAYFAVRNHGGGGAHRFTELSAFGLTTVGCMALTPLVSGIVVQRELTRREVHEMIANCVVPFIGGWLVDAYFDHHPERDLDRPPVVKVKRHHG
jgi:hypothetical protein